MFIGYFVKFAHPQNRNHVNIDPLKVFLIASKLV